MKLDRKCLLFFVLFVSVILSCSAQSLGDLRCPTVAEIQGLRGPEGLVIGTVFVTLGHGTLQCDQPPQIPLTKLSQVVHFESPLGGGPIECQYFGDSTPQHSLCVLRLDGKFDVPRSHFTFTGWFGGRCSPNNIPVSCPFFRFFGLN